MHLAVGAVVFWRVFMIYARMFVGIKVVERVLLDPHRTEDMIAADLIMLARENDSDDDITVVVIKIQF